MGEMKKMVESASEKKNEEEKERKMKMKTEKRMIGRVGVDSGQLMLIDPSNVNGKNGWKEPGKVKGIQFWGAGQTQTEDFLKAQGFNVQRINNACMIFAEDDEKLARIQRALEEAKKYVWDRVVSMEVRKGSYTDVCELTLSNKQSGSLPFTEGHDGLAVACSTGFGDGSYEVFATFVQSNQYGERISKVEVVFISDEELMEDEE